MRLLVILSILLLSVSACKTVGQQVLQKTKKYAVVLIDGGTRQQEIAGYEYDSNKFGTHQPLKFTDLNGKHICSGNYSLTSQYAPGLVSLSCFDGRIKGDGKFQVKGRRGSVSYGVASVKTANEEIRIVFGMTKAEFEQRKKALAILNQ